MKTSDTNIIELLSLMKEGNEGAFQKIFNAYHHKLYNFVFSFVKSDFVAKDILQEVFIKVWVKRSTIDLSTSFDSFMYTVARNQTYNHLRKIANQDSLKSEVWKNIRHYSHQTEDSILLSEYNDIIDDILDNLPVKKRSIYILSRVQGKSNQEIAELLNISQKTVKNHLWKTLQLIKTQLQPYLSDTLIPIFILFLF